MLNGNYLPALSGHAIYLHKLIPLFKSKGYGVEVLAGNSGGYPRRECIDGLVVHRVRFDRSERQTFLRFTFRILVFLFWHRRTFDILHWHGNLDAYGLLPLACKILGKKSILQMVLMGSDDPDSLRAQYRLVPERSRLAATDRFTIISSPLHERCVRAGFPLDKLRHIPQGVDVQKFCPVDAPTKAAVRLRMGLPQDKKIASFVGSVIHRKGVDVLIDAWEIVERQCPDTLLLLVGPCDFGSEDWHAPASNAFVARSGTR